MGRIGEAENSKITWKAESEYQKISEIKFELIAIKFKQILFFLSKHQTIGDSCPWFPH